MTRLGIRTRVVILVGIAVLPLIALALHRAENDRRAALARAQEEALLVARAQASFQAAVLNQTRNLLGGFAAAAMTADTITPPDCHLPLKRIVEASPFHHSAGLADAQGNLRCSVRPLTKPINVGDRDYFRRAVRDKGFAVSAPLTGRRTGAEIIVSAQPLLNAQGNLQAVLIASLDTAKLMQSFRPPATAPGTVVMLADRDGRIAARYPDMPEYRGKTLPALAANGDFIASRSEGFLDVTGLDGVRRIAAFAKLPDAAEWPFYVVAGIPRENTEAEPHRALLVELAGLAMALGLALAMAFIGAQRMIIAPLRQLAAAAQRYGRGDLSALSGVDHRAGEIGALARTLDGLAIQNQRATRALKALSAGNRALLREKRGEPDLLHALCRVAVEQAGYVLALVNYAERNERKSVRTVAQAGRNQGFVEALDLTWSDSERGRGSVGTAIRTGRTCVVRSLANDPRFAPWREAALAHGFGSIASFPLRADGDVIGTFSIIAAEEDAFDAAELELLDEMAADLSFGIEMLRASVRLASAEEAALRATTHDRHTGLPGRIPFQRAVDAAIAHSATSGEALAVLVVNLPGLQDLHDSLGHDAGNTAVMEAASRLKRAMGPATELARLSTDDFGLMLAKADAAQAGELARRLQAPFSAPIEMRGIPIDVRIAIGTALSPAHGTDAEVLVRRAGIAARQGARRDEPFYVYCGATQQERPERLALAAELRRGIEQRQLVLHLQPKVELAWGGICAAEALVRWQHPDRGLVPPMEFVPVAEQTGLIRPMTDLVIEMAVRQLHAWRERTTRIPIAVNLSARNLHDARLFGHIEQLLGVYGVPARLLEFEITETAVAEDPETARMVLQRLRDLGCKLYIDDFGTGYSSLSHLVTLPVDAIKIDRGFVTRMSKSREARAVVASIVLMARELGLKTVAEGVETAEDADALRQMGCTEAQGYFFARPAPPDQVNWGS